MDHTTKQYKGYIGSVQVDFEGNTLTGKILHVLDLVTFVAETPAGLQAAFQEAVDDYLETCQELGRAPDKPFSGQFQVRIAPEEHRALAVEASRRGLGLNELVREKLVSTPVQHSAWQAAELTLLLSQQLGAIATSSSQQFLSIGNTSYASAH